jgi:hypothetical protein
MGADPTRPAVLLRVEGAGVFLLALLVYRELGISWILFAALFLAPDLSILAYLGGSRVGAVIYNAVHTYAGPLALYASGFAAARLPLMALALVWAAHIGIDRMLGFGLKYASGFRDTHLSRGRGSGVRA